MIKIQTKTTGLFITIAIIAAGLVALLVLRKSRQIMKDEVVEKMLYQTQYQASTFEKELSQITNITQSIEASLLSIYPNEGITSDNIESIQNKLAKQLLLLGKKMQALSLWIVFNPELVAENQNIDFFDKNRDGSFKRADGYNITNIDSESVNMKWWYEAIEKGEVWTEPYYWKDWDMELITYSKAIYIDSLFIGCIGSDIDFTQKRKEWKSTHLYSNGYFVLINEDFNFILHPQYNNHTASDNLPSKLYHYLKENILKKENGYLEYNLYGTEKIMAFQTLSNRWSLLSVVPIKEIYKPIYQIGNYLLIILFIVIIVSVGIAIFFSKTITSPIERLGILFNKARNGDLTVRSNIKTNDELEKLGNQFNYFLKQMQTMITQLKEKEISLIEAKEKAIESDKLKTAFLENLSHEIRTPLTGIVGYAELLNTDGFSKSEKTEFLSTIQKNNDYLLKFIEDIITFSKLERGILHSKHNKYLLSDLFNQIEKSLIPLFESKNDDIQFKTCHSTIHSAIYVHTDYDLLFKSLIILLDNAYKFTPSGHVTLGNFYESNKWGFYIKDTGIGIPSYFQKLIFKKFYKYADDKTKIYRGVGMGLAIVAEIVKILNGKISVKSEKEKGSEFIIEFKIE